MKIANVYAINFKNKNFNTVSNTANVSFCANETNDKEKLQLALDTLATINKLSGEAVNNIKNKLTLKETESVNKSTDIQDKNLKEAQDYVLGCYKKYNEVKGDTLNLYKKTFKFAKDEEALHNIIHNGNFFDKYRVGDSISQKNYPHKNFVLTSKSNNDLEFEDKDKMRITYKIASDQSGQYTYKLSDSPYIEVIKEYRSPDGSYFGNNLNWHIGDYRVSVKNDESHRVYDFLYDYYPKFKPVKYRYTETDDSGKTKTNMEFSENYLYNYKDDNVTVTDGWICSKVEYKGNTYSFNKAKNILTSYTPTEDLNLSSKKGYSILRRAEIHSIEALSMIPEEELSRKFDRSALWDVDEIYRKLEEYKLKSNLSDTNS